MPPRSPARPVGASPLLGPRFGASRLAWLVAPALVLLAAAIVVSNVIGSGILITPAFIAATAPSAAAMLGV